MADLGAAIGDASLNFIPHPLENYHGYSGYQTDRSTRH